MTRLTTPARSSFLIALTLCCGCNDGDQRRINKFAANPVSRSVSSEDQKSSGWAIESSPVAAPEDQFRPQQATFDPMQAGCEAELRQQSSYTFDFRLTSINGKTISKRQFSGRLLIVDIWATWCGPCVREVPSFIDLQDNYRDDGLAIVGINFERGDDDRENRRRVDSFAEDHGINYPLALGNDSIVDQIDGFRGFPTTLFIDGNGQVRLTLRGSRSHHELETFVKILLQDSSISSRDIVQPVDSDDSAEPPQMQSNPFASASMPTRR